MSAKMTREERKLWRLHPDYSTGFWRNANGEPLPSDASLPLRAGYEGYEAARNILVEGGFSDDGNGDFTISIG